MTTKPRFSVTEIENSDGEVTEYQAIDALGEYDPCSCDTWEEAVEEVQAMRDDSGEF